MIRVKSATGFTVEERLRLASAVDSANHVMETDSFKLAVITFSTSRGISGFTATYDVPVEIYQRLMGTDWAVDFSIASPPWWKFWTREVAKENSNGLVTFNRKFYDRQDIPSLANTVMHETCHVAGYHHSLNTGYHPDSFSAGYHHLFSAGYHPLVSTAYERENSCPYAIGAIVEKLARPLPKVIQ